MLRKSQLLLLEMSKAEESTAVEMPSFLWFLKKGDSKDFILSFKWKAICLLVTLTQWLKPGVHTLKFTLYLSFVGTWNLSCTGLVPAPRNTANPSHTAVHADGIPPILRKEKNALCFRASSEVLTVGEIFFFFIAVVLAFELEITI